MILQYVFNKIYLPSSQLLLSKVVSDTFNKSTDELLLFDILTTFVLFWIFFEVSEVSIHFLGKIIFLFNFGPIDSSSNISKAPEF